MCPQHVKIIVQNALRLYSQDRTGLVDYALESGGKNHSSDFTPLMSICYVKQTLVFVWLEVLTGENRAVSCVLQSVDLRMQRCFC